VRALLQVLAAGTLLALAVPARADDPVLLVDPIVGTSGNSIDGPSDTFPGADAPFGMVQWSPDTPSQPAGGGYLYNDGQITGFSLTHLSGPGCSVFGDISILPTTGVIEDPASARQPFTHVTEEASPGFYAIQLGQPAIQARLSVTTRTGLASFTFPAVAQANVLINAASDQAGVSVASVRIVSGQEVVGSATSGWFCGMPGSYTVYFALRFNRPFLTQGTWAGDGITSAPQSQGTRAGAWVSFDTTQEQTVKAQAALSFVSIDGALANLHAEAKTWDVDAVRAATANAWRAELDRIRIQGGTFEQQRVFYTALYHALLHPNTISDVDGRYTGFDGQIHQAAPGHMEYATFSGWDVYRTQIALVAMLDPKRASDMMRSLVHASQQSGWLPKWSLVNAESAVMGGDPADPIIASAYAFGARDFDARVALAAMVKGATQPDGPGGQGWYVQRPGLREYQERGYVVNDHTTNVAPVPNGASLTLEYALDDFSISRMAAALGDTQLARTMLARSQNWANLFDSATGLIAPRDRDGAFMQTPITENGQSGFQEGNAAQYTWMVPQDLRDLVRGMGGPVAANKQLDTFFSMLDAGQDKPYAWLGNEPSIGSPWVYLSTGAPWKAQGVIRDAMTQLWGDTPDGLPGNDDLGTMSAWYVWCAIGLYPQNPASGVLDIGAPLFSHIDIKAPGMAGITIGAPAASTANAFIQSVSVDGRPWARSWITYAVARPTRIDFTLGSTPNSAWAAAPADAPPSYSVSTIAFPQATLARLWVDVSELTLPSSAGVPFRFTLANPPDAADANATWRAIVPDALRLSPASGNATVSAGQSTDVSAQLSGTQAALPGLYDVAVAGVASNGALIERATRVVRFGSAAQNLAYATNFFDDTIQAVDWRTHAFGAPIAVAQYPRDLTLDPGRHRAYVVAEGVNEVNAVDLDTGTVAGTVRVGGTPWGIRIAPDGATVWVANNADNTVQPIDTRTLAAGAPIKVGLAPGDLAVSPDGATLFVADQNSDDVTPVDLRNRTALAPIAVGARPRGLAITPDGKTLFASNMGSNSVTPIDVASGKAAAPIPVGVAPRGLAVSPDGRWLFVANFGTNDVTPIEIATRTAQKPIPVGFNPTAVTFAPDGSEALVAESGDNDCAVIDVASRKMIARIPLGTRPTAIAR
jgi:predicted alpha-1,2-mannosidase